ncbi:MAG: hypothetical protein ACYTJ0_09850 [Planctomycetota bacterium]|jgi:hypothetical protein
MQRRHGDLSHHRGKIVLIILTLLILAIIAGGAVLALNPDLRIRLTSADALIERVLDDQAPAPDAWAELDQRTLTPDQRQRLMAGLLEKRTRKGYLPTEDDRWLTARIDAGEASEQIVKSYYDGMLEARVLRPNEAVAGAPTRMVVEFHDFMRQLPDRKIFVLVDGVYLGGAETPIGRQELPTDIKLLPRQRYRTDPFAPEAAGRLETRFVFWHVLGPPALLEQPIQWNDDGTPVIDDEAIWSRRVELLHAIEVAEPQ